MGVDLQSNFRKFHDAIKFDKEENKNWLTEKRDMLVRELQTYLKKEGLPSVKPYNQGSYAMGTGIKPPEDGDFDIDVALVFDLDVEEYKPVDVKRWVLQAMSSYNNRKVIMKRPCVRVQYEKDGTEHYHVDLAIYGKKHINKYKCDLQIAKGFVGSKKEEYKVWEDSEPFKLKDKINNKFEDGEERAQFKRIICYLKRWKDENFSSGDGAPTGIALTAIAYHWYSPHYNDKGALDDLSTMRCLLWKWTKNSHGLTIQLPVKPHNNLFEKITNSSSSISTYKAKVDSLHHTIEEANSIDDESRVIKLLQSQFGSDFPS